LIYISYCWKLLPYPLCIKHCCDCNGFKAVVLKHCCSFKSSCHRKIKNAEGRGHSLKTCLCHFTCILWWKTRYSYHLSFAVWNIIPSILCLYFVCFMWWLCQYYLIFSCTTMEKCDMTINLILNSGYLVKTSVYIFCRSNDTLAKRTSS